MEIPTDEITADYYKGRVQRIVNLQRRWQGWVKDTNPSRVISRPMSALANRKRVDEPNDRSTATVLSTSATAKRRPVSATMGGQHRSCGYLTSSGSRPLAPDGGEARPSNSLRSRDDLSVFSSCIDKSDLEQLASASNCYEQFAGGAPPTIGASGTYRIPRSSQFGVSDKEVSCLNDLCEALKSLERSHKIAKTKELPAGSLADPVGSTEGPVLSVEIVLSSMEAAACIFRDHPLFNYLFGLFAQWLPRGIYSNAFPLLAEANPLPHEAERTTNRRPTSPSAPHSSAVEPQSRLAHEHWIDWIVDRSGQWSRLCVPLGTVTSVFEAGRSARPPSPNETLGHTLFGGGSTTKNSQHRAPKSPSVNEPLLDATISIRSASVASAMGRFSSKVPKKVILRNHLVAWSQLVAHRKERGRWVRVCSKSAHKDTLYLAFFKWKCETSISLAVRKTSHAERLHYVVQDDARRIQSLERSVRDLTRQRDGALARVDQLTDDSKLAFQMTRDIQNSMIVDFRNPLYAINAKRTTITSSEAQPLASGVIYFEAQPAVPMITRANASSSSSLGYSATNALVRPTVGVSLPVRYAYDCGAEKDVDGIAMPCAEHYRSYYRISVEGLTEKQQQQCTPVDPLLAWVNETVVATCEQLMGSALSPPASPLLASTVSPQQLASARSASVQTRPNTRRPMVQDFDAFGELGQSFKDYLSNWQAKCESWDDAAGTLRDASKSNSPLGNHCVVSMDSRSTRHPPSVEMSCHISRPRDLSCFPFVYVLLLYRICPKLIQLFGPSQRDFCATGFDDWANSVNSVSSPADAPGASLWSSSAGSHPASLITLEEQVAILVRESATSIDAVYPILERAGLVQHLPRELLSPSSSSAQDATTPINPKASDATHRLLVARMKAYASILDAYEPFWEHHLKGAPFHRALSLPDVILQRRGANHATEVVMQELLAWVRSVLTDEVLTTPQAGPSSHRTCGTSDGSLLGASVRMRPVALDDVGPGRRQQARQEASSRAAQDATPCSFSYLENLSENFGEGLELLWLLVQRLTPLDALPMMHRVADELRNPLLLQVEPAVTDAVSTPLASPALSTRAASPPVSPQHGGQLPSPKKFGADSSKVGSAVVVASTESNVSEENPSHPEAPSLAASSSVGHRPPCIDALPIKQVAHLLCVTLRDAFGGHVPKILFDELYLATPSLKALYVSCLYAAVHRPGTAGGGIEESNAHECRGDAQVSVSSKQRAPSFSKKGSTKSNEKSPTRQQPSSPAPPAGPTLFPTCLESISTPTLLSSVVLSSSSAAMKNSVSAEELLPLLTNRGETLFLLFLKYATLGAPAPHIKHPHQTEEASSSSGDDITSHIGLGVTSIGTELLVRDILCGFAPPRTGAPNYLSSSAEECAHALTAVRRSYFDTAKIDPSDLPHSNLGAAAFLSGSSVKVGHFGELLVRLCCSLSTATFSNLRKAVPPKAAVLAYLPGFDASVLLHRVKLLLFVVEEHCAQAATVTPVGDASGSKGTDGAAIASKGSGALRAAPALWGRDAILTMSSIALHQRRQSVVDPRVFRERAKLVVALFVRFSNWCGSERWQVIEERRMTPQLFSLLCSSAGIVRRSTSAQLPDDGQSIRSHATKAPALGWSPYVVEGSTPSAVLAEYTRVSPLQELLTPATAAASERKAAKRMVSALQRGKSTDQGRDEKAALTARRHLLATSQGLNTNLLRSVDVPLAAMIFSVVSLSRSSSAASAQDKIFRMTGAGAPTIDRHAATIDSEGFCEEDMPPGSSQEYTLSYAGFCEVIAFLADQCVAHPWLSSSARTAIFVEYLYGVVFE